MQARYTRAFFLLESNFLTIEKASIPDDMTAIPIRISHLHQSYGKGKTVLADLSLQVHAGDSIALVGMNGAGKTTLIKSMLDFIAVDKGKIEIYGVSHSDQTSRRHLAFLPENFKPPYYLKGLEFLHMMLSLYGVNAVDDDVYFYADRLDLDLDVLEKPARQYSKGMAQKLGLIANLASGRNLLVLDEPMSGLDPKSRHLYKQLLKQKKDSGTTIFFSTHLLADVNEVCNKLAILHEGRILFLGTPDECCSSYESDNLEMAYMRAINADC